MSNMYNRIKKRSETIMLKGQLEIEINKQHNFYILIVIMIRYVSNTKHFLRSSSC